MYEQKHERLLSRGKFILRLLTHAGFSLGVVAFSLLLGVLGYHFTEGLSWLDALLNSAMLLGGMGPVNPIQTTAGKLFASFYALFSGLVFLVVASIIFTPLFHRFLHRFHIEGDEDESEES